MFTGLVEGVGVVVGLEADDNTNAVLVEVASPLAGELAPGDSVAVNGACLTARAVGDGRFAMDAVAETLGVRRLATSRSARA